MIINAIGTCFFAEIMVLEVVFMLQISEGLCNCVILTTG